MSQQLHEGQILTGPLFNEPMRVETVASSGPDSWVLGLVGVQSGRFTGEPWRTQDEAKLDKKTTDRGHALMATFACPYLGNEVQLTEEREKHIAENHPDLLPAHRDKIAGTLADPDEVRRSARFADARVFSKWYDSVRGGKFVVAVVVTESGPTDRNWIVTAYIARKLVGGNVEWKRS